MDEVDEELSISYTPTRKLEPGEFCHHRHEPHLWYRAYNGMDRCKKCGLYREHEVD